jgi:hypothetical protein
LCEDFGATPTTQFAISAIGSAKTPRSPLFLVVGNAGQDEMQFVKRRFLQKQRE